MSPPTFRDATVVGIGDDADHITLDAPTTVAGDLIAAILCRDYGDGSWTTDLPLHWVDYGIYAAGDFRFQVAFKKARASEPATYTFDFSDTLPVFGGAIYVCHGGVGTPTDGFGNGNNVGHSTPFAFAHGSTSGGSGEDQLNLFFAVLNPEGASAVSNMDGSPYGWTDRGETFGNGSKLSGVHLMDQLRTPPASMAYKFDGDTAGHVSVDAGSIYFVLHGTTGLDEPIVEDWDVLHRIG